MEETHESGIGTMGNRDSSDICPDRVAEEGLEGIDIYDEAAFPENSVGRNTPHRGRACAKVLGWEGPLGLMV